ncbi:hypothetical protein GCM10028773_50090 [Spirosoma koreense]
MKALIVGLAEILKEPGQVVVQIDRLEKEFSAALLRINGSVLGAVVYGAAK